MAFPTNYTSENNYLDINVENMIRVNLSYYEDIMIINKSSSQIFNDSNSIIRNVTNETTRIHYLIFVPMMIFLCFVSVIINIKVLVSVFWLRSPISPTLKISLSLAAADALASLLLGIGLFVNSLLPRMVKNIPGKNYDIVIYFIISKSYFCSG